MKKTTKLLHIVLTGMILLAPTNMIAQAKTEGTAIKNEIFVSSNTGGNTGHSTTQGSAKVEVHITQKVDGESQEPIVINEEKTSESLNVEVKNEINKDTKKTEILINDKKAEQKTMIDQTTSTTTSTEVGVEAVIETTTESTLQKIVRAFFSYVTELFAW